MVANKALAADEISEFVKSRMAADEATKITLLVPATAGTDPEQSARTSGTIAGVTVRQNSSQGAEATLNDENARHRLEFGLNTLRLLGATADGLVGNANPAKAIAEVLDRRQFDEVAVFTLPKGISKWLHLDLPHHIERKFHVPVTVITTN